MKVSILYHDKNADVRKKVAAIAKARGLTLEIKDEFLQRIDVADKKTAEEVMKELSPLPNIELSY